MERTLPLIKIMPPGEFTSVEGTKVSFTEEALRNAAEAYDPVSDPAPMVIGHPALDHPAYGWIKRVTFEDGHLCAEPDPEKLEPAFAEAVRQGRFRKVSGRFYFPNGRGNPKPGHFYLKHVGFLGAAAPAVKGLGTVAFGEGDDGDVTIEQPQETSMTDTSNDAAFAEREAALARREADIADRETNAATREQAATAALHASNVSFAESLVTATKLPPAMKPIVIGLLDELDATATVAFGEGEGAQQLTPNAAFRKLFDGARATISFGEEAPADPNADKAGASFAAPQGYVVDPKALQIHGRALELQGATPGLSYIDAVKQAGG
jgi:hypothetical protein